MSKSKSIPLLLALFALLGTGLWCLVREQPRAQHVNAASPAPASLRPAAAATRIATPVPPRPRPPTETESASVRSIGSLIGSPSLDDKTVMAGLAQITLETDRSLPERTEALGHLLNLAAEDPAPVLLPLIDNRRIPDALCNQILDDSLNAAPAWQADACLAVLAHRKGPALLTRAHDHLTFLIGTDYGDNLAAWTKAVALAKATPAP
jgi:hypothetical protein